VANNLTNLEKASTISKMYFLNDTRLLARSDLYELFQMEDFLSESDVNILQAYSRSVKTIYISNNIVYAPRIFREFAGTNKYAE